MEKKAIKVNGLLSPDCTPSKEVDNLAGLFKNKPDIQSFIILLDGVWNAPLLERNMPQIISFMNEEFIGP